MRFCLQSVLSFLVPPFHYVFASLLLSIFLCFFHSFILSFVLSFFLHFSNSLFPFSVCIFLFNLFCLSICQLVCFYFSISCLFRLLSSFFAMCFPLFNVIELKCRTISLTGSIIVTENNTCKRVLLPTDVTFLPTCPSCK